MAWAAAGEKSVANRMFRNRTAVLAVAALMVFPSRGACSFKAERDAVTQVTGRGDATRILLWHVGRFLSMRTPSQRVLDSPEMKRDDLGQAVGDIPVSSEVRISDRSPLACLFSPASVAVIGATDREGSVGGTVASNLLAGTYKGRVYAVNPRRAELFGRRCYASIGAVTEAVD